MKLPVTIGCILCTANLFGQAAVYKSAAPRFTDPERRAKLEKAFPDIDAIFQDFTTRNHVPGAAWGIVIDGELAHTGVTGYRDLASKSLVTPDSVFRIASMTKSFTAIAILKLRDEGKLSLDDPAEKYVPEMKALVYPTSDSPKITIRHLLSHATGFPEDNPWGDQQLADTDEQLSAMIRGGIPFSNAPAVAYEYSNFGFAILGRVVASLSPGGFAPPDPPTRSLAGAPKGPAPLAWLARDTRSPSPGGFAPPDPTAAYTKYVTDNVLKPLGMRSTTLEPSTVPADRLADGYRWEDGQWKSEPLLANGAFGSMGGMLTTLSDLGKYVGAFLASWPPRDGPETGPIRRSSLREMQQVWRPAPASVTRTADGLLLNAGGYAYGLRVSQTCQFPLVVAHSGGLPGFGSQMRWLPDYGVGIIAFGNLTYTGWQGTIDKAFDALLATGGLRPRTIEPSPALTAARDGAASLVVKWDDVIADRMAAQNLFLDRDKPHRRADLDDLHRRVGECTAGSGFAHVENALRGDWTMSCERGKVRVAITLAPTAPPKVQFLSVTVVPPSGIETRGTCQ